MRSFVVGTAGHVDHGKTALVRALTGVETDRLPEEQRRGISIELGFARWKLAEDVTATLIDVPGHRRLVHAMIAGASGIELVLLVIAANEGVMPQTREHARVCEELGIRHAVVALTKSDLVDEETLALAEVEARELLEGRFELTVVTCSATRGIGLDRVRDAVAARLRGLPPWRSDGPARLWVDRVLSIRGSGTVITGTLSSGTVRRGDELALLGAGTIGKVVARELRVHDAAPASVESPSRLAVNLAIAASDVHRGDLLTSELDARMTTRVDVELRGAQLGRGAEVSMHTGTVRVAAHVTRIEKLEEETQLARLALAEPRPLQGGDRFVLRGHGGSADVSVACGGTVLDARPHARVRRELRHELVRGLRGPSAAAVVSALLEETAPRPLEMEDLLGRLSIDASSLLGALDAGVARGELVAIGSGFLARTTLIGLADRVRTLVAEHAAAAPLDRGLPLATVLQKIARSAGPHAAEAAVRVARARRSADDVDLIAIEADVLIPAHKARPLDDALGSAVERAHAEITMGGAHGASLNKVAEATRTPPERARAILAVLERQGAAVRAGEVWFARSFVEDLRARVVDLLSRSGRVTVAEFKALADLPRNQAVLLLEHFDQVGVTRRVGDARVLYQGK